MPAEVYEARRLANSRRRHAVAVTFGANAAWGGMVNPAMLHVLQRTAGNAAVSDLIRPHRKTRNVPLSVQACGAHACSGECQVDDREIGRRGPEDALLPVQQLVAPGQTVARALVPVQRWPGDGMTPPGDCTWATYTPLRLSVESAKAVVSMMGACARGDSCYFLATKIAAVTAEIVARVALDTTCFKGGDSGHRTQVNDKVNMLNNCYDVFKDKNCDQKLIEAMEKVVAAARAVIEAAAMTVAAAVVIAAVAALVVAVIALAELIAAAAAAAAEAAVIAEAVAALLVLLRQLAPALSAAP